MKRVIALSLIGMVFSGCGMSKSSVAEMPLVTALTTQEVIDYYKKSLEFDTIVTKTSEINEVSYQTYKVTDEREEKLIELVNRVEELLSKSEFTYEEDNLALLDESTFNYIKGYLNDRKIINGKIESVSEALGYYFVDVEYEIASGEIGEIKGAASLLGLHGAFKEDYTGIDSLDNIHINKIVERMNRHLEHLRLEERLVYSSDTSTLSKGNGGSIIVEEEEVVEEDEVVEDNSGESIVDVLEPVSEAVLTGRDISVNIRELNRIAGSSASTSAYMPKLNNVFNVPNSSELTGVGIYPQGARGMGEFGFSRQDVSGQMMLRYVFKQEVGKDESIKGVNVYPVFYDITSGISTDQGSIVVPEFIMRELENTVERSDRAIINTDLSALMSGTLYEDMGVAILTGYNSRYSNVLRNMSTIRRIIARDVEKGTYLLEVETIRQEGSKGVDSYGTYRDKNYVSIKQVNEDFVITDIVTMQRRMITEPSIRPDSAVTKRLIALNLSGEVGDTAKEGVVKLLNEHYAAGTARVLRGPNDIVDKGMYDVFNSDPALLSTDKLEYMNSTLRNILVKYGTNVSSTYSGIVTEWVGGSDNQVEFTTEEVVVYEGTGIGNYMEVYYLMSRLTGEWKIDDMKIMSQEEKSGAELEGILSRISNN